MMIWCKKIMGGKDYEVYEKKLFVVCLVISAILLTSSFAMPVLAAENTGIETSSVTRSVPGYYKCTGSDVNIRSGPGTQYTIVGTLNYGTKVYVYSISNGWAKISLGGIYRYVSADYLREL